jgi:hypothetical protein
MLMSADKITQFEGKYVLPDGGSLMITAGDGALRVAPEGQEAMAILFPTPYARMLPKYNGKTVDLVNLLAKGKFDQAVQYFSQMSPDDDWAAMAREWWQSFDTLGSFQNVEVIGTSGGGGAKTCCRINFGGGTVTCRFFWMGGKCGGMVSEIEPPEKKLMPVSESQFAGYSLASGSAIEVKFPGDGTLILDSGDKKLIAKRVE